VSSSFFRAAWSRRCSSVGGSACTAWFSTHQAASLSFLGAGSSAAARSSPRGCPWRTVPRRDSACCRTVTDSTCRASRGLVRRSGWALGGQLERVEFVRKHGGPAASAGCIEGSGWFTSRWMPRRLTCILCDAIGTQTQGRILRGLEAVVAALTTVPAPEIPCSR